MRYPAAGKLEIIRLVEQSALPVRRTLEKIGIPRATFYRWYALYQTGGPEALDDRNPKPDRVRNRIPDDVRERIVNLALDESALSPRELAVRFTDSARARLESSNLGLRRQIIVLRRTAPKRLRFNVLDRVILVGLHRYLASVARGHGASNRGVDRPAAH
jgi:transposase-like protein